MWQVLFRIPYGEEGIPVFGFGMMLFVAFLACTWLAGRRAELEGIAKEIVQDIAIWLFLGGLLGARLVFLLTDKDAPPFRDWFLKLKLLTIWEGGIVLYGSLLGGTAAYFLAWGLIYRKRGLKTLPFLDAVAPSIALGIALGRIGCLLNGCCYGQVAAADCSSIVCAYFPMTAPCREGLVESGAQSVAGFLVTESLEGDGEGARIGSVEPGSAAYRAGLRPGAIITSFNGKPIRSPSDLNFYLGSGAILPRGQTTFVFEVKPTAKDPPQTVAFVPRSLGLYPTQVYETISMVLLLLVLLAYYPLRHTPGQVMAVLMICYGMHRYLNELLRDDPRPKGFESYGSLFLIIAGLAMWWLLRLTNRARSASEAPASLAGSSESASNSPPNPATTPTN